MCSMWRVKSTAIISPFFLVCAHQTPAIYHSIRCSTKAFHALNNTSVHLLFKQSQWSTNHKQQEQQHNSEMIESQTTTKKPKHIGLSTPFQRATQSVQDICGHLLFSKAPPATQFSLEACAKVLDTNPMTEMKRNQHL